MTARCAQYTCIWVPWKLYVSAKSADDCARISTLQSYHYIRRWNYFRRIPTNVITVPDRHGQTDRRTDRRTTCNLITALCHWFPLFSTFKSNEYECTMNQELWTEVLGAAGGRCCVCVRRTLAMHLQNSSTFLREMTPWPPSWKCDIKNWNTPSIDAYLAYMKNNHPANFITTRLKTTEAGVSLKSPNKNKNNNKDQ